jgi:uncharacterized protein (DUF1501 family)
MVFLYGGNDGYNTWVPYADDTYYKVRPNIAVPRDAVLKITERHGFHPSLAALVPSWEAKDLAIVQGLGYPLGTQQHFRDGDTAFTGYDGRDFSGQGWVTRALASRPRGEAPDAVAFDVLDIRAADPMGPFRGDKLGVVQVYYAADLLNSRSLAPMSTRRTREARERSPASSPRAGDAAHAFPTTLSASRCARRWSWRRSSRRFR